MQRDISIHFSLPWKVLYINKVKQITELARSLWLFAWKSFQRNFFLSMLTSITSLQLLWALAGLLEGNHALREHLSTWRALEHLGTRRVWVIEGTLGGRGGGTRTLKVNALLIISCNTQKSSLNVCLIKKYFCVFIT